MSSNQCCSVLFFLVACLVFLVPLVGQIRGGSDPDLR